MPSTAVMTSPTCSVEAAGVPAKVPKMTAPAALAVTWYPSRVSAAVLAAASACDISRLPSAMSCDGGKGPTTCDTAYRSVSLCSLKKRYESAVTRDSSTSVRSTGWWTGWLRSAGTVMNCCTDWAVPGWMA